MVQPVTKEPAVCCLVPLQQPHQPPPPSLPVEHGFLGMTGVIAPFMADNTEANRQWKSRKVAHQPPTQV